jgi:hypothetical protein
MNPRVIIISKKNEPSLNLLMTTLKTHKIECQHLIHSKETLREMKLIDFKGFLIFCIPPSEIKEWFEAMNEYFLNYFKIYNYNNLVEHNFDSSVFLMFDYIISGEQDYQFLNKQLEFLKYNYWRKIPYTKLGIRQLPSSKIIGNMFNLIERSDIDLMSLEKLSKKLKVSNRVLRKEIKEHLKLQFSELKSTLINHYREF